MELLALVISLVGAAAWIPAIVNLVQIKRRKVEGTIVDYRIIQDAKVEDSTRTKKEIGTILMLGINFFIADKSFFAKNYEINVSLSSGGKLKGIIVDGVLIEHNDNEEFLFLNPLDFNFNLRREIVPDKDNIRIVSIMIQNANFDKIEQINEVEFIFKNEEKGKRKIVKSVIFKKEDFPEFNRMRFIDNFFKKV